MKKRLKIKTVDLAKLSDILSKAQFLHVLDELNRGGFGADDPFGTVLVKPDQLLRVLDVFLDESDPNRGNIFKRIEVASALVDFISIRLG